MHLRLPHTAVVHREVHYILCVLYNIGHTILITLIYLAHCCDIRYRVLPAKYSLYLYSDMSTKETQLDFYHFSIRLIVWPFKNVRIGNMYINLLSFQTANDWWKSITIAQLPLETKITYVVFEIKRIHILNSSLSCMTWIK